MHAKVLTVESPLRISFNEVDEYVRNYDSNKYRAFFYIDGRYERLFDRTRDRIMLKSDISDFYPHKYAKIKISSVDDLPLEKALNMYNVVIPIKSVLNINHKHYCCQTFSRKCSNK